MRHHSTIRRGLTALTITGALLGATLAGSVGSATATPPTTDHTTAAGYAAHWLASQVGSDGSVSVAGNPSPGATLQTAVALATAGVEQSTFDATVSWLAAHVDDATINPDTSAVDPGNVGYLLLVVDVAGQDPSNFGGVNLVTRLSNTISTFNSTTDPGLYGAGDPTYDGTFRQGVAIVGLEAAGASVPTAATNWLVDRQCGTSDPMVRGAWEAYRLTSDACTAGDPNTFTGVDTNSTAMATTALVAAGVTPTYGSEPYFEATQNTTGGWGYLGGLPDDPNSDAVVIQSLVALGSNPAAPPWVTADGSDPFSSLLSFQLGCDADPADQGAFTFPGTDGAPNGLATEQGVWGAAARPFPLVDVTWTAAPVPCPPATTTTTAAAGDTTTTADAGPAGAATPVSTDPAFTG